MTHERNSSVQSPPRRRLLQSLAALPVVALPLTGGVGRGSASHDDSSRVHGDATTLTLLPSSKYCIDPPAGATDDEAWDGDCEDTSAADEDASPNRKQQHYLASAMPDHNGTTLDAWFLADQTSRLPANRTTALDIRKDFPEYPDQEFRQYRIRNHLDVSFTSRDGATIHDWSTVQVESNVGHPPVYVLIDGEPGEDNDLRDLVEEAPDVPEPEVQDLFDELEGAEKLRATVEVYADHAGGDPESREKNRVEVDGVEGVRVTQIYGGADSYILILKEIYDALHDRYGPEEANRRFLEYTGFAFDTIPAFIVEPPWMYTFLDVVVMADGAQAVRVWDASPYPKHYLYAGEPMVDETRFVEGDELGDDGTVHDGDWHPREDDNEGPFAQWVSESQTSASPFPPANRDAYELTTTTPVMQWTADGDRLSGTQIELAYPTPKYPWEGSE